MKLSALASLTRGAPFALLGPGFAGGRWRLLSGLQALAPGASSATAASVAARERAPILFHLAFEDNGSAPRCFTADSDAILDLEFDLPYPSLAVNLHTGGYSEKVAAIREAIAAGDVYQVCLTVRADVARAGAAGAAASAPVALPLAGSELFSVLCAARVPTYAAWVRLPGGDEFVSGSPELFLAIEGRRVRTQPMKGTSDPNHGGVLEGSAKDEAELAMITDLLRNDLTSVCVPRTVRVICPRRVLKLPYAVQTISEIEGELPPAATPLDALAALHPGGSVTGAPKRAALAMIRALEETPRGAYCGALGLWEGDRATASLLIRTASRAAAGATAGAPVGWTYGVGGGIVWDSDPEAEMAELHVKLGALRCPTRCCD